MFKLSSSSIEQSDFILNQQSESCGAFVSFAGYVRERNDGKDVTALEYEAYPDLCRTESHKIIDEAQKKFNAKNIKVIHRTGRLKIGEMAIWIGVQSGHREQAFQASRYVIDEIKKRVPVWKKEFYTDGCSDWINCADKASAEILIEPISADRYSRQTSLPNWGSEGQEKLSQARVCVIGAGGLGSAVLMSLAGSGIGTIGVCDGDELEEHNLHRQFIYNHSDVGQAKAQLAKDRIQALNPSIQVDVVVDTITSDNIKNVIKEYDVIVDGTDNFRAHYLINDVCVLLKKPLVQASIYQFEGQVHVFDPEQGSCLRCIWPEPPKNACGGNCSEAGVVGALPGALGHIQALEVIKYLLCWPSRVSTHMIFYNFLNHSHFAIRRSTNEKCPLCGSNPQWPNLEAWEEESNKLTIATISAESILKESIENYVWIDVRENYERMLTPAKEISSVHLPMSTFENWSFNFSTDQKYVVFCSKGVRSSEVIQKLSEQGIDNCFSLEQGIGKMCDLLKKNLQQGNV